MNSRIQTIIDAATMLFLRQGYSKTQISHIAKKVGVSVGIIYLDFAGKKEIMHFVLKCVIDPDFINHEFNRPITDDLFNDLENEIIDLLENKNDGFASHLEDKATTYSFASLISDAFDLLARYAVGCLFIEKNYFDFKNLSEAYLKCRKEFFTTMARYLEHFITLGTVRPVENLELTNTLIIEILSWWAMDRRYISFETCDIPLELAKKTCLDNILSAYKL